MMRNIINFLIIFYLEGNSPPGNNDIDDNDKYDYKSRMTKKTATTIIILTIPTKPHTQTTKNKYISNNLYQYQINVMLGD